MSIVMDSLAQLRKKPIERATAIREERLFFGSDETPFLLLNENHEEGQLLLQRPKRQHVLSGEEIVYQSSLFWRGEETRLNTVECLKKLNQREQDQEQDIQLTNQETLFYKDQKMHHFGGRVKPQKLFSFEDYFQQPSFSLSLSTHEKVQAVKKNYDEQVSVISLEQSKHDPLFYQIELDNGSCYESNHLVTTDLPFELIKKIKSNNLVSNKTRTLAAKSQGTPTAIIELTFNSSQLTKEFSLQTFFLPYMSTQEVGHLIVQFEENQKVYLLSLLERELSADELTKRVKRMKRVFYKSFPQLEKNIQMENIFHHEFYFSAPSPDLHSLLKEDLPGIFFIGPAAPLSQEILSFLPVNDLQNHLFGTRMLLSLVQYLEINTRHKKE